ncbi:MAG TPA: ATP-binding protein [Syntrophorhabdaceae bacterium]|nr:ATP-binding protein [Syntrophorhabdaceae bacterium]
MSSGKIRKTRDTLALRLTLWYAGIFTVSSFVAFFLFYTLVTSVVRGRTDEELMNQARRYVVLASTEGLEEAKKAAVVETQAAGLRKVFFRMLYADGVTFSSSNMSYWKDIGIHVNAIRQLVEGADHVFETMDLPERRDEVRILYVTLGPNIILQIGEAVEGSSRFLEAFRRIFIVTMGFLIVLAAGIGWFMARRAVSGVEAVTRTAREISAGTLGRRVPVNMRGDEIDQLAVTFNEMLDRIEALVREMKEMSDNIAHDLKSPITRIRGAAEVTLSTSGSPEEFENMAASTIEECDRLLDTINTMLMISRTESGVDRPPQERIKTAELVREACDLYEPAASDKGIVLTCEIEEAVDVAGDKRMIRRMVANLIDNAIKYTPSGGSVDVRLSRDGSNRIALTVSDSGMGISPEDLPRIFDRFYRGDRSRSEAGLGLGLSLARAIARAHGGDITVTSIPDRGATFTVTLPKKTAETA